MYVPKNVSPIVFPLSFQDVHTHILDLSLPKDIIRFGKWYVQEGKPLHVLINNAGCMVNTREVDADGLEKNFATNSLGTHLLTMSLIPALKKAVEGADEKLKTHQPRVITVSSGGMLTQKLDLSDLQSERMKNFDGTTVYAMNKRQQVGAHLSFTISTSNMLSRSLFDQFSVCMNLQFGYSLCQ
jgi:dehydrogenase/reductase SDR family protein 12